MDEFIFGDEIPTNEYILLTMVKYGLKLCEITTQSQFLIDKLFICVHFFLSFFMPEKFAWTGRPRTISTSLLLRGGPRPAEFSPLTMIHCAPIGRATASSRSSKVGLPPEPSAAPTQSWDMLGQFLNGMHMHMQVWYSNIGLENQESQKGHHLDMLVFKVQRL